MHILVTGAAGMIGRKLVESFARQPQIATHPIMQLTLVDVVPPRTLPSFAGQPRIVTGDIADVKVIHDLVAPRPDVIFISPPWFQVRRSAILKKVIMSISQARRHYLKRSALTGCGIIGCRAWFMPRPMRFSAVISRMLYRMIST